jgi:hypothetical protein
MWNWPRLSPATSSNLSRPGCPWTRPPRPGRQILPQTEPQARRAHQSRRRLGRQALARRALRRRRPGLIDRGFRVLVNAGPARSRWPRPSSSEPAARPPAHLLAGPVDRPHPPHRAGHRRRHRPAAPGLRSGPAGGGHLRPHRPQPQRPLRNPIQSAAQPRSRRDHTRHEAGGRPADHPAGRRAAAADELLAEENADDQPELLQARPPQSEAGLDRPLAAVARRIRVPLGFLTAALYLFELGGARPCRPPWPGAWCWCCPASGCAPTRPAT